jgi:hypothetical protein
VAPRRSVKQLRLRQLGGTIQTAFMERWYGTLRGLVAPCGAGPVAYPGAAAAIEGESEYW